MRAANLTLAALAFIHDLRTGQLPSDDVRGTPLDMSQYAWLFGAARIPTGTSRGCKMSVAPDSRHVVVLRRGYAYWFDALDLQHRPLWTEAALVRTLQAICDDADARPPAAAAGVAVGILTANKRGRWHAQREKLIANPHNHACLTTIDEALFVLCLDDEHSSAAAAEGVKEDPAQLAEAILAGTYDIVTPNQSEEDDLACNSGVQVGSCTNRWWDKLQIVVTPSGSAGINFEHTALDGHTVLRFVADVYTELIMRFARSIHARTKSLFNAPLSPHARGGPVGKRGKAAHTVAVSTEAYSTSPRALEWRWTQPLASAVAHAEARLSDLVCANECAVLEYDGYGKTFITAHGFSPDAWVQMALQAAYFSLYGRNVMTYEPAMTKHFRQGRTEAIRTVSPQSVEFCKAYVRYQPEPAASQAVKGSGSAGGRTRATTSAMNKPSAAVSRGAAASITAGKAQPALGRIDNGAAGGAATSAQEVVLALRQACATHTRSSRLAAQGLGCDRHLYALHELWRRGLGLKDADHAGKHGSEDDADADRDADMDGDGDGDESDPGQLLASVHTGAASTASSGSAGPGAGTSTATSTSTSTTTASHHESAAAASAASAVPALFTDPGWAMLNSAVLSTSNCGNPALRLFGFAPTSDHGFGLGYIIKDRGLALCASSHHRQTKRFLAHVRAALARMHAAVVSVHAAANTRRVRTYIDASGHECDVRTGLPIRSPPLPSSSGRRASSFSAVGSTSPGLSHAHAHARVPLANGLVAGPTGSSPGLAAAGLSSLVDVFSEGSEEELGVDAAAAGHVGSTGYGFFDSGDTAVAAAAPTSTPRPRAPASGGSACAHSAHDSYDAHGHNSCLPPQLLRDVDTVMDPAGVLDEPRSPSYLVGRQLVFDDTSFP